MVVGQTSSNRRAVRVGVAPTRRTLSLTQGILARILCEAHLVGAGKHENNYGLRDFTSGAGARSTKAGEVAALLHLVDPILRERPHSDLRTNARGDHGADAVALLNFASARNPGGGFLGGADRSLLYTDHLIYSPAVPFFRTASNAELLETPFLASVITAPAPNAGAIRRNQPGAASELPATFLRRWMNILAVAQENLHRTLILGAWGCGAFRNDPKLVARAAREALSSPRFAGAFSRVIFSIPGFNRYSQVNLEAFHSEFSVD